MIAVLNGSTLSSKDLSIRSNFLIPPQLKSALLARYGQFKGQYFAISNKHVGNHIPVLAVHFDDLDIYKAVERWYLKYHTNPAPPRLKDDWKIQIQN